MNRAECRAKALCETGRQETSGPCRVSLKFMLRGLSLMEKYILINYTISYKSGMKERAPHK